MRYTIFLLALAAAGCAGTPENAARVVERCSTEECFRPRDVRRVEVLDDQNLIVYTGSRECAFRVEVRGVACRLDFALDINFVQREPGSSLSSRDPGGYRYSVPQRICEFTPRLIVYTGVFDVAGREIIGGPDPYDDSCRVAGVESLTEDELVELYVDRRLAPPPPPAAGGRLETPEPAEADEETTEEGSASGAEVGADSADTVSSGQSPADAGRAADAP